MSSWDVCGALQVGLESEVDWGFLLRAMSSISTTCCSRAYTTISLNAILLGMVFNWKYK